MHDRLQPCSACERHVRAAERECPFCGHALATVAASPRWTAALLGLCLAACTSSGDAPGKPDKSPAANEQEQEQAPTPELDKPEPTTAIEPEPPPPPELELAAGETGEAAETTGAEQGETGSAGTSDGASLDEPPAKVREPEPVTKKRPAKTYGGPPKPIDPLF